MRRWRWWPRPGRQRRPPRSACARDRAEGTRTAPDFGDAVRIHRFLDLISRAAETGVRQTVDEIPG